jgi:hypothetical protein
MTDLNEAPTSVTFSVISPKGFPALVTIRDAEFKELVLKMTFAEEWFEKQGFKPQVRQTFGAKKEVEYVPDKLCPVDSGKLKVIISKKDGKTYWTCENGHYDFTTKTTTGCKFICSPETYEVQKVKYAKETESVDVSQY